MWNTPLGRLRGIGLVEGVSFLVLLGVAMPLKYLAGHPEVVTVVGWIHGLLFVLYVLAIVSALGSTDWPWHRGALAFVAGLVPFGPFVHDRRLRAEIEQEAARAS